MGLVGYESTGWFSRKLVMRVSTVERVEDGTVYAQMPVSRKGDSGLPAYAVVNGNYLLSGVTGVWSSTYEGFEMQHMSNVSVAGNATVEVIGNETARLDRTRQLEVIVAREKHETSLAVILGIATACTKKSLWLLLLGLLQERYTRP